MNTVVVQEIIRYNRLLQVMTSSLAEVMKALKGLIVMSDELELLVTSLYDNQVSCHSFSHSSGPDDLGSERAFIVKAALFLDH